MILTASPTPWENLLNQPLAQRLHTAPAELLGVATSASAAAPAADLVHDVHMAIATLPELVRRRLEPLLLGVFFMTGAGPAPRTEVIGYANGDPIGAAVILDPQTFDGCDANTWASRREHAAFLPAPEITLETLIAADGENDRCAAIRYALLPELGRVLTLTGDVVPVWWETPSPLDTPPACSYLPLSWTRAPGGGILPLAGEDFPARAQLTAGGDARLAAGRLAEAHTDLGRTAFPTLAAAASALDDFACSFASYVHEVLLGKPQVVTVLENGQPVARSADFWQSARSARKRAWFDAFFASPAATLTRRELHARAARECDEIIAAAPQRFLGLSPFLRLSIAGGDLPRVAQALLERAGQDQENPFLWINMSTAFFAIGQRDIGLTMLDQALSMQRLYRLAPAGRAPALRLLMLMAPGDIAENTPLDCLLDDGDVELIFYYASAEAPLPPAIPEHDVAIVTFSDSDANRPILIGLDDRLRHWTTPVINLPACIPNTERSRASALLQDVPGLLMPPTWEAPREVLEAIARGDTTLEQIVEGCPFPIILRPVGSHAGRDLARLDDAQGVAEYLAGVGDSVFYLSRFIDYSGADGLFRKYRVALIAGQPFASHMAVSSHWMIHYLNAGMTKSAVKRAEEAAFMEHFDEFASRHALALSEIYQRAMLDYLCIDCAETRDGELLIFEIDHAMVVHAMDPVDMFPYKQAPMQKLRRAFEDFLFRLARINRNDRHD